MRRVSQLILAGVTVGVLGLQAPRDARGQSWTHGPMEDQDLPEEKHSKFWEHALQGIGENYADLLEIGGEIADDMDPLKSKKLRSALMLFDRAIALKPDLASAYFARGAVLALLQSWNECVTAMSQGLQLAPPNWAGDPTTDVQRFWAPIRLASCHLHSKQYERALDTLMIFDNSEQGDLPRSKSLAQKKSLTALRNLNYKVYASRRDLIMGEALMALGRVNESIFFFRRATTKPGLSRSSSATTIAPYSLAVALDRAGWLSESAQILGKLTRRDSNLTPLRDKDHVFTPASEKHYYFALARVAQGRLLRALYHLRRFLRSDANSQWRRQVLSHIEAIGTPSLATNLNIRGPSQWQREPLVAAIERSARSLRHCLAEHDDILARILISSVYKKTKTSLLVRATIVAPTRSSPEEKEAALLCLEEVARKIHLPAQSGMRGAVGSVDFLVLGDKID